MYITDFSFRAYHQNTAFPEHLFQFPLSRSFHEFKVPSFLLLPLSRVPSLTFATFLSVSCIELSTAASLGGRRLFIRRPISQDHVLCGRNLVPTSATAIVAAVAELVMDHRAQRDRTWTQ